MQGILRELVNSEPGYFCCSGMLREAWRLAVAATDWGALHQRRHRLTDAELADELGSTVVAQAAALCYGPVSEQQTPVPVRCHQHRHAPTQDCVRHLACFGHQETGAELVHTGF